MVFGRRASVPRVRRGGLMACAIASVALIAGCGGSGHHGAVAATAKRATPATLVAETVGSAGTIDSGRIDVTLDVTLDGVKQLDGKPIALKITGPFTRDAAGGISADLDLTLSAAQANVTAGLDIVDGALYVGLGGQFYKLRDGRASSPGATGITGATGGASGGSGATGMTGHGLGFDPSSLLTSPQIVGTADVGGVTTEHLHAPIDVPKVLAELTSLLSRVTGASGASGASSASGASGASGATLPAISGLSLLESAITSATVDIYTGVADHIVRRVQAAVAFTVPALAAGVLGGLSGGSVDFEATLTDLNKPQSVTAPANAQPASKILNGVLALESQFGSLAPFVKGLGSLAGLGGTGASLGGLLQAGHRSGAVDGQG